MLRIPLFRKALVGVALTAALLATATAVFATHSWSVYHWSANNLQPTVVDKTSSPLYKVEDGVLEWAGLNTAIQPTLTDANKGNITVTEAFSPFWLGLARIFIDEDGHITKGEVKLNTRLLQSYGSVAADHVLCQELGHVLGLGHNRSEFDTCMNDTVLGMPSPNAHDTEQLNIIYDGHDDGLAGGGEEDTGGGGNCPPGKPNHKNCQPAQGHWITVHVFPIP